MKLSAWTATFCALASTALAQPSGTLNLFSASETPEDDFHLSRPTDLGHLRFGAQVHVDYANDPLVYELELGERDTEAARVVEHQVNATVGLSFGIKDRLVIFAGLPVVALMNGDSDAELMPLGLDGADGAGLGDVYLGARVRLFGEADDTVAFGAQLTGTFPTAGSQRLRGEDSLALHPELLLEVRPGPARIVLNVGGLIRQNTSDAASNLRFSDELTFGLGFAVPVWRDDETPNTHHLDVHVQAYGSTFFKDFFEREASPFEATAGLKYFHPSGFVVGAAGGPGLTRGFGAPDLRVVGMVAYVRPADTETEPGDRDADGLLDDDDTCPDEPEDVDEFEDADGCPDPDNDRDGILDVNDACINVPENINEWEDEDGCPDEIGDSDGDGCRGQLGPVRGFT